MKKTFIGILVISSLSLGFSLSKVDLKTLEHECLKQNNGESCLRVGKIKVSKKNILSSYLFLQKGCELNNYQSCTLMGSLLLQSKIQGQQLKAIGYLTKACNNGKNKNACTLIKTVNKNTYASINKLKTDCIAGNSQACLDATAVYFKQGEKGLKNAFETLDKACSLGNKKGCKTKAVLIENINKNTSGMKGKKEYFKELGISQYFSI